HLPARARDHAARRRPRRGRGQARHLELAAAGPARGDLHGVEELLRRGFPDVHPGADLRGRAAALVRLLPVSRPALVRPAPGPSAPPPARQAARRWARTSPTGMLTTVTTSAARKSHSAQAGPCAPRPTARIISTIATTSSAPPASTSSGAASRVPPITARQPAFQERSCTRRTPPPSRAARTC